MFRIDAATARGRHAVIVRLLACVVAQAIGMGLLHLLLARGARRPFVLFSAASGGLGMLTGLAAVGPALIEQARVSAWTIAWFPAFGLGFFAAGAVLGAMWLPLVHGADLWLRGGPRRDASGR